MIRVFLPIIFITAFFATVSSCGYPDHKDPVIYDQYLTQDQAFNAASIDIEENGGKIYTLLPTGSMEPLLHGGDYVVVKNKGFDDLSPGEVIAYVPDWSINRLPTIHRVLLRDSYGLLVAGDAVKGNEEAHFRVTPKNYIGVVTAVYRVGGKLSK